MAAPIQPVSQGQYKPSQAALDLKKKKETAAAAKAAGLPSNVTKFTNLDTGQITPKPVAPIVQPVQPIVKPLVPAQQPLAVAPIVPKAKPTVATPQSPLTTTSVKPVTDFNTLSDKDKQVDIGFQLAKSKNLYPDLSDEQLKYLISSQIPDKVTTQGLYGDLGATLESQTTQAEKALKLKEGEVQTQSEKLIAQKQEDLQRQYEKDVAQLQQVGKEQQQGVQQSLSFSGFGRSTFNAEQQAKIGEAVQSNVAALTAAKNMQLELFKQQQAGVAEEQLAPMRAQINQAKQNAQQFEIEAAQQVAELNAQNQVTGAQAVENLIKVLGESTQPKVNKDASELLGYVADEFGQPVMQDEDGNPVPISTQANPVKYSQVVDPYTGNIYFYDPANPIGSFTSAPVNGIQTYTGTSGLPTSSPGSDSSGLIDAKGLIPDELYTNGGNCYLFAKQFVPNIPAGASTKAQRLQAIKTAEQQGFGGVDMSQVQVGDAVHTTEGNVGHTFVVSGVKPAQNGGFDLTALEANYKTGKITYGRTLNTITDAKTLIGWIKPTGGVAPSLPTDGNNYAIDDQISGKNPFSAFQIQQFKQYEKSGKLPSFVGKSQVIKDQQQLKFEKDFAYFAGLRDNGKIKLQDYDPEGYKKIKTEVMQKGYLNDAKKYKNLVNAIVAYKELVDQAGAVGFFEENQPKINNAYATLKDKWKEAANLGALTGPDLGLIEEAIPNITNWTSIFKKLMPGDAKEAIIDALDFQMTQIQKSSKQDLNLVKSAYPDIVGSDIFTEIESYLSGQGKVKVKAPNGQIYEIDQSDLPAALQEGAKQL